MAMNMNHRTWRGIATYLTLASLTVLSVMPGRLLAGPVGEQVEAGSATFTRDGANTVIDVASQNAIINYQSFNISAQEYVRFNQLNAASRVLNRIDGAAPTHIDGHLSANGQVFFVNPAGVMFGQGAVIDVAGIYAAAGSINSSDFLNGINRFTDLQGTVANHGTINSQFVALVGKRVINDGIIFAPGGVVTMVAGDEVLIGEKNGTIMVKVEGGDPNAIDAAVVNTGAVDTGSTGQVALGAGDMYWLGVKQEQTGSIKGGDVVVDAAGSSVDVTGTVDSASSTVITADEIAFYTVGIGAGDVTLTGQTVTVGNISGAGAVAVLGTPGDDLHTLDFDLGLALPDGGLTFDAGAQDNPKPLGDTLIVKGGSFDTVEIVYTDSTPDGFGGNLIYDGVSVGFAGFEPLTNTGTANDIIFTLPAGPNTDAVLGDNIAPSTGQLAGSTFETTTFTYPSSSLTINLGPNGDTLDINAFGPAFTSTLNIVGGAGNDTVNVNAFSGGLTYTFDGGGGTDTLTGPDATTAWAITGADDGTIAGNTFTDFANLTGGTGADTFSISGAGSVSGTITGGGGSDTVNASALAAADATLTGANAGAIAGNTFADIDTLVGGSGASDTLTAENASNVWASSGPDAGTVDSLAFSGFENWQGGSSTDTFTIAHAISGNLLGGGGDDTFNLDNGGSAALIDGEAGTGNTLTGPDAGATFALSGANQGTVAGTSFQNIANLTGGSGSDTFQIGSGDSLSGAIVGGGSDDTLDYDADNFGAPVSINLQSGTANAVSGGFSSIESFIGDAGQANTLTGANAVQTWTVDAADGGNIGGAISFSNFPNITGGNTDDTFNVTSTGSISGTLSGGAGGTDALTIEDDTSDSTIDINSATPNTVDIDGTSTTFANIDSLTVNGDDGDDDFIVAPSTAYTISVDGGSESAGDSFDLDTTPLSDSPSFAPTGNDEGTFSFPADPTFKGVDYVDIESLTLSGPHNTLDMAIDLNTFGDNLTIQLDAGGTQLELNGSSVSESFDASMFESLNILGNGNANTLTINETAGGLPSFGGAASGAHTNAAFTGSTPSPANIGLNFSGGGGADALVMSFITAQTVGYFADDDAAANSGVINVDGAFNLSFNGLAPIDMNGTGGTLLINTTANTLADNFLFTTFGGANGRNQFQENPDDGGFETVRFGGWDTVDVTVGNGNANSSVTLDSLDANSFNGIALAQININGGPEITTVNVEHLPSVSLALAIATGNGADVINLAPNTFQNLTNIQGVVTVDGGLGSDTLNLNDFNATVNRTGTFDETTIVGFGMANGVTNYVGVENINYNAANAVGFADSVTVDGLPSASTLTIDLNAGDDDITVNFANFTFNSQTLDLMGGAGTDTLTINDRAVGETFTFQDPGATGDTTLDVAGGVFTVLFDRAADADPSFESLSLIADGGADDIIIDNAGGFTLDDVSDTVVLRSTGGQVTDANDAGGTITDIAAADLSVEAQDGIDLQTDVDNLDFLNNGTTTNVVIANADAGNALLTLRDLGVLSARGNLGGGTTDVSNASPVTLRDNWTFEGDTALTASKNDAVVDDFTLDGTGGGATITLDSGSNLNLTVSAGDDIAFTNGATVVSAGGGDHTVNLNADQDDNPANDGDRGSVTQTGTTTSVVATDLNIDAGDGIGTGVATPFRFNATNLSADSSGNNGNQFLREVDGLTTTGVDAGTGDVHLHLAAGTIDQDATDAIVANELSLTGTGSFNLDADNNDVDELAATVAGGVTYINEVDGGPVAIDAVTGGQSGVTLTGGALDVTADGVVVNQNVSAAGVALTGRDAATVANDADTLIDINAGVTVNANAGNLTITGDDLSLDGTATLDGSGDLTVQPVLAEDNIEIGDANDDAAGDNLLQISDAEIARFDDGFANVIIGRADGSHDIEVNSATFTDPLIIRSPVDGGGTETISIIGTLAGTGNASIDIDGAQATTEFTSASPSITTQGQYVTISDNVVVRDGISATIDTTAGGNDGGATVTIVGTIDGEGADSDSLLTLDEELLSIDSGTGGSITLQGAVGSNADLALSTMGGGTLTIPAGGINVGNNDLVLYHDSIVFGGALTGTEVLRIGPLDLNRNMNIEGDLANGLNLTQADIDTFTDGWALIELGRDGGNATMEIAGTNSVQFTDSVVFLMNGTTGAIRIGDNAADGFALRNFANTGTNGDGGDDDLDTGVDSIIGGDAAGANGFTLYGSGNTTTIFADEVTAALALVYNDAVVLANDVLMDTTNTGGVPAGAHITFNNTLDSDNVATPRALTLVSGSDGDITFSTNVGAVPLGDVVMGISATRDIQSVTANGTFTATSLNIDQFADDGGNITFNNGIDTSGIAVSEQGGVVDITTDADGNNDPGGNVSILGPIDTRGRNTTNAVSTNGGDVSIVGNDVVVTSIDTSGGATTDGGTTGGSGGAITLDAIDNTGTPSIALGGSLTSAGAAGGAGVGNGGNIRVGNDATGSTPEDLIALGTSDVVVSTTGDTAGNVLFDGTLDGNGQSLTINATGSTTSGDVEFGDDDANLTDTIDDLLKLTVSGANDINFRGLVDSDGDRTVAPNVTDIELTADNDIRFFAAVELADELLINDAHDVDFDEAIDVGNMAQSSGTGTTTFSGTVDTNDPGGLDVATERIVVNDDVTTLAGGSVILRIDLDDSAQDQATTVAGEDQLVVADGVTFSLNGLAAEFQQVGGDDTPGDGSSSYTTVLFGGNIITAGGQVAFDDDVEVQGNSENAGLAAADNDPLVNLIDSSGGNITFNNGLLYAETSGASAEKLYLDATDGDILITGRDPADAGGAKAAVGTSPAAALMPLGDLRVISANDTLVGGTVNVLNFTQETGTGSTEFQGDIVVTQDFIDADVLDSTDSIDTLDTRAAFLVNASGSLFLNGAQLAVEEATAGTGGGNIFLRVNDLDFTGGDNSVGIEQAAGGKVGVLVVEPFDAGGDINIGVLSNTDVNALADGNHVISGLAADDYGFVRIFIGRSDGFGSITLNNNVTFHSPLFVRSPVNNGAPNIGNITVTTGGVTLTEAGDPIVLDAHVVNLGGQITTNAGDIFIVSGGSRDAQAGLGSEDFIPDPGLWLGDDVLGASTADGLALGFLTGATTLDSTGGDIIIENSLNGDGNPGDFDLTLDAGGAGGNGDIRVGATDDGTNLANPVTGRVGGSDRIGNILIVDANDVVFGGNALTQNATPNDPDVPGTFGDPSLFGTGSIDAAGFEQQAGTGDTLLFGTSLLSGVRTSLRTGGYANQDGGNVDITLDGLDGTPNTGDEGVFFAQGQIVARGGTVSAGGGAGKDGGFVAIQAGDIEVRRIDTRGSNANGSGPGGDAGTITLDATDTAAADTGTDVLGADDAAEIVLHGDLLARGGFGVGSADGSAADVTLGEASGTTDVIILDPNVTDGDQVENELTAAAEDVITVKGNDIDFNGTVDGVATDADGESLYVQTFDNLSQSPNYGDTTFQAPVGSTPGTTAIALEAPSTLRTDFDPTGGVGDVQDPTGDFPTVADANGRTIIDTTAITVLNEMTFNDAVIIDDVNTGASSVSTLTATDAAGTIRFNNLVDSDAADAPGFAHDLVLAATTTIFDDNGTFGQGFNDVADDGVDARVGSVTPLQALYTTDGAGPDTTFINTTSIDVGGAEFDDAVIIATDLGGSGDGGRTTITASAAEPTGLGTLPGDNAIQFDSTIDSTDGEFNELVLLTTGGGTTRINGRVGAASASFASALGHFQTDLTGDADTDPSVADGITEINTDLIQTNGASQQYNDPVIVFADVTFAEGPSNGDIVFNHFLDADGGTGPFSVTVNTGGASIFRSEVGLDPAQTSINALTTDADGTTEIHADVRAVTVDINDAALIGVDANAGNVVGTDSFSHAGNDALVTIGEDGTTTSVTFHSTVDSIPGENSDLTIISDLTQFKEDIGSTDPLGTVTTTLGGGGTEDTILGDNTDADDGETVTAEADQFIFEDDVILQDNLQITGNQTGDGSDDETDPSKIAIDFQEDLDGDGTSPTRDLTLITTGGGLTRFGDASDDLVGGGTQLGVLKVDNYALPGGGDGTTLINAMGVTVDAEATFNDKVAIGTDGVTISAALVNGTIRFNNTLDGQSADGADVNDLTLDATTVIFDDDGAMGSGVQDANPGANDALDAIVGGATPLGVVTIDGAIDDDTERTVINTTAMTADEFIFSDPVIVAVDIAPTPADPNVGGGSNGGAVAITGDNTTGAGNPTVVFNDTVDSSDDENNELLVYTTNDGLTQFFADIGNRSTAPDSALGRLFTNADGVTEFRKGTPQTLRANGASVIHDDPVVLYNNLSVFEHSTTGVVYYNSTLDGDGGFARNLTVTTNGGMTRFGDADGTNADTVGGTNPLGTVLLTDFDGVDGSVDVTQINADFYANFITFNDNVQIGRDDAPFGPGDGVITIAGDSGLTSPATLVSFNGSVNSNPSLIDPGTMNVVTDLASNLAIDAGTTTFGNNDTNDRVGTRVDDGAGTDGSLGLLYLMGTPGPGNNLTILNTDQFLADQFYFDSDVSVNRAEVSIVGLTDGTVAGNDISMNPFVAGLSQDGVGGSDTVGDAIVFNGTVSSQLNEFNDLNLDTVNAGDVWINSRVGTMDTTTAADVLALPTTAGGIEGTELGFLRTDNPANPLAGVHHLVPDVGGDLAPNGTTHINTDVVKAGGALLLNIHFYDAVEITFDGPVTYISDFSSGIFFHNTLDSEADEENDLTLYAPGFFGDGDIRFYDVVGDRDGMDDSPDNSRLGDVIVRDVRNLRADDLFKAASFTQEGLGTVIPDAVSGGRGNTMFLGMVDTSGSAATGAPGNPSAIGSAGGAGDGGDIFVLTDGDISFYDGAALDSDAGAAGNFRAQPDADNIAAGGGQASLGPAPVYAPEHRLMLNGMFTAKGGGSDGVFLLSPNGRTSKPTIATIRGAYLGEMGVASPLIDIDGASIYVGANEIITAPSGPLTMTTSDAAGASTFDDPLVVDPSNGADENPDDANIIHGDMAALETITLNAMDIRIRLRGPGPVIGAANGVPNTDLGTDIISGGNIFYLTTPTTATGYGAGGDDPFFANPGADFDTGGTLGGFVGTTFDPVDTFQLTDNAGVSGLAFAALDPSTIGPSNANAAEAIAAAVPTPEQSGEVLRETIVGDFQRQLLAEFAGVDLSGLTPAQRLEFLTGRELFNDLPSASPVSMAIARALLTENRLLYDPVANMLAFYRDFFLEQVINPETGQTELISRHIEHRRALAAALQDYQGQNDGFTAEGFAAFLISSPDHTQAYRVVQGLKTLTEKFQLIGLTPRENGEAMTAVAEKIAPEGMTAQQLMEVARVMPKADETFEEPELSTEPTPGEGQGEVGSEVPDSGDAVEVDGQPAS